MYKKTHVFFSNEKFFVSSTRTGLRASAPSVSTLFLTGIYTILTPTCRYKTNRNPKRVSNKCCPLSGYQHISDTLLKFW